MRGELERGMPGTGVWTVECEARSAGAGRCGATLRWSVNQGTSAGCGQLIITERVRVVRMAVMVITGSRSKRFRQLGCQ